MSIKDRILTKLTSMQFWLVAVFTPVICCVDFSANQANIMIALIAAAFSHGVAKQVKKVWNNVKNKEDTAGAGRPAADDSNLRED